MGTISSFKMIKCHQAKIVKEWMEQNDIRILEWPAKSPDLNPSEYLRRDVKRQLTRNPQRSLSDLETTIHDTWN